LDCLNFITKGVSGYSGPSKNSRFRRVRSVVHTKENMHWVVGWERKFVSLLLPVETPEEAFQLTFQNMRFWGFSTYEKGGYSKRGRISKTLHGFTDVLHSRFVQQKLKNACWLVKFLSSKTIFMSCGDLFKKKELDSERTSIQSYSSYGNMLICSYVVMLFLFR